MFRVKEFEIVKIGVEEGVDLGFGIKDSLLPNVVLEGGNYFNRSMSCKWTTLLVDST